VQAPKVTALTVSTSGIAAGDFDGDKKTDLIVDLTRENQRGVPGPGSAGPTNDSGLIVGAYIDSSGAEHGYTALSDCGAHKSRLNHTDSVRQ